MVFGLFESKSEKLTKKYFKISRELFATSGRVLKNPDSEWWKKYCCETMRHLKEFKGMGDFLGTGLKHGQTYQNKFKKF